MMNQEEIQNAAFNIILHSGNSRTLIHSAFELMRKNNFENARKKLEEASNDLLSAHQAQSSLLQKYSSGDNVSVDIIMVHAQDHLMTTMTLKEVALEMMFLYKKIAELNK